MISNNGPNDVMRHAGVGNNNPVVVVVVDVEVAVAIDVALLSVFNSSLCSSVAVLKESDESDERKEEEEEDMVVGESETTSRVPALSKAKSGGNAANGNSTTPSSHNGAHASNTSRAIPRYMGIDTEPLIVDGVVVVGVVAVLVVVVVVMVEVELEATCLLGVGMAVAGTAAVEALFFSRALAFALAFFVFF